MAVISFGHAMFFGLGGYIVGIVAYHTSGGDPLFGWPGTNAALAVWPLALLACALGLSCRLPRSQDERRSVHHDHACLPQMAFFILSSFQTYGGDDGLILTKRNALPFIDLAQP